MNTILPIKIGNLSVRNPVFLAPMSGVTDLPFRNLAWKYGAGLVISEMVASEALVTGQQEMLMKSRRGDCPLHVVQLSGRQAHWMVEATKRAEAAGADIIDINMGCPSKRVTTGYSGSALMRDLDHALRLIEATVEAANIPVTLKMRLGWDHRNINAPQLAKRAVDAGVQMITVHGRTRCQFYKGNADWSAVRAVSEAIDVPLLVNGDICNHNDASEALVKSGADGIMIGRAAYGAPWLPGLIAAQFGYGGPFEEPTGSVFLNLVVEHYEAMLSFYGQKLGVRQARKHLGWYFDRLDQTAELKQLRIIAMTSTNPDKVKTALRTAISNIPLARAA